MYIYHVRYVKYNSYSKNFKFHVTYCLQRSLSYGRESSVSKYN